MPDKKNSLHNLPEDVKERIEQVERMRRDFVANVSHELRTPLTVIHGYLEILLNQTNPNPKLKKIYQQMNQHSERMETLIQDLLLLSHLEFHDEHDEYHQSYIDVPAMLRTIAHDAQNISGSKQHHIVLEVDDTLGLIGAQDELKSLFSNIIINAVKYTPAHGNISIKWQRNSQQQAEFTVIDTGIGIAKKHIPRLTERFYRVDKARSRESGGTGLGLAIVKHVLIRHQGELVVSSKVNHGSTFICTFPREKIVTLKN